MRILIIGLAAIFAVISISAQNMAPEDGDAWTDSVALWGPAPHGADAKANLFLDERESTAGTGSVACTFSCPASESGRYLDLRFSMPVEIDIRDYDKIVFDYRFSDNNSVRSFSVALGGDKGPVYCNPVYPSDGSGWKTMELPLNFIRRRGAEWSRVKMFSLNVGFESRTNQNVTLNLDAVRFEKSGDVKPALLFVGGLEEEHKAKIIAAGFNVAVKEWRYITWDGIKEFNALVFSGDFYPSAMDYVRNSPSFKEFEQKCALFNRFMEEGGGLFIMDGSANCWSSVLPANDFLKPLNASILSEAVFEKNSARIHIHKTGVRMAYALTTNVVSSPLTAGIGNLWWPNQGATMQYGQYTLPLSVGSEWQVVVRAGDTACSVPFPARPDVKLDDLPAGTYTSAPPLMAVRDCKRGRIALLDINQSYMTIDGRHIVWDGVVMEKGDGRIGSDWEKLLLRTYQWLVAPSMRDQILGGYLPESKPVVRPSSPSPVDWDKLQFPAPPAGSYKGLLGLHTRLSSGSGEIAEYVSEAKKAGYSWVAFGEDYDLMDEKKWEKLTAECKRLSGPDFLAIPGLQFKDQVGNNFITYGMPGFPPRKLWEAQRIGPNTEINRLTHPGIVVFNVSANPLKPKFLGDWTTLGIFTYKDGKLIDECMNDYLYLQRNTFRLCPVAVHLIYSPGEIAAAAKSGYQTYVMADALNAIPGLIMGYGSRFQYPYPVYVSSGPRIKQFQTLNDYPANLNVPGGERWRLKVSVEAPEGLKEVTLSDDREVFYRFLPGGERVFDRVIEGYHDKQRMMILRVKDVRGQQAVSGMNMTRNPKSWFFNCSDNMNTMGAYMRTAVIRSCGKIINPPGGFEFHFSGFSLGGWLNPMLEMDANEPITKGTPPNDEEYVLASRDVAITDRFIRYLYPPGTPVGRAKPNGDPRYVLTPSPDYNVRVRTFTFYSEPNSGYFFNLVHGKVEFKRSLTLKPDIVNPRYVLGAGSDGFDEDNALSSVAYSKDRKEWVEKRISSSADFKEPLPIPVNGGLVVYPVFAGLSGIYSLSEGTGFKVLAGNGKVWRVYLGAYNLKREIAAGQELDYELLQANVGFPPDENQLEKFKQAGRCMGVTAEPDYKVAAVQGKVTDTRYALRLQAENYGFSGTISQAELPVLLPVIISGLNDNWDAGIWDKETNFLRRLGVSATEGYLTVDTNAKKHSVYIGNLLVCDSPEIKLILVERGDKEIVFQAHNPTDKRLKVKIEPARGFAGIFRFSRQVEIGPGSMLTETVKND